MDARTLALKLPQPYKVAAFTKSGGSWFCWMLTDLCYLPDKFVDTLEKREIDKYILKSETIPPTRPQRFNLHIKRHPLDVACSAWNYMLLTDRAKNIKPEQFWNEYVKSEGKLKHINSGRISWKQFIELADNSSENILRYEDILDDTENCLRKILGDDNRIPEVLEKYSLKNLREREPTVNYKQRKTNRQYSFFNKASKYYYREIMPKHIVELGLEKFKPEIEKYWPESL